MCFIIIVVTKATVKEPTEVICSGVVSSIKFIPIYSGVKKIGHRNINTGTTLLLKTIIN